MLKIKTVRPLPGLAPVAKQEGNFVAEVIKKNIRGWVKNKITGEVEALLIGNDKDVNEVIKQCEKGPHSSNVTQVKIQDYKQEYSKKSFDILSSN